MIRPGKTPRYIPALSLLIGSAPDDKPLAPRVGLGWNDENLLVRFECDGPIYAPFTQPERDQPLYQGDTVEVFLDVLGDGRQWIEIQLAPDGQIFDQVLLLSAPPRSDADGNCFPTCWRAISGRFRLLGDSVFWAIPSSGRFRRGTARLCKARRGALQPADWVNSPCPPRRFCGVWA